VPPPLPNSTKSSAPERTRSARFAWDALVPLRLWHLASLDAPTVAVVWTLGFAWAAGVRLPAWVPLLVALVAWPVYIADRLLDARSALLAVQLHRLRQRHHFHWRHRRTLIPMAVAAACAASCIVVFLMPVAARERNSVLAAAALAYFTGVHIRRNQPSIASPLAFPLMSKELLVGLLFTAACALPALSRAAAQPAFLLWPLSPAVLFFTLLAWSNCHAIERWESRSKPSRSSSVFVPAILLALIGPLLAAILCAVHPRPAALVAAGAASALLLALLDRLRTRLTPLALRTAADLVLLTPLVLLFR